MTIAATISIWGRSSLEMERDANFLVHESLVEKSRCSLARHVRLVSFLLGLQQNGLGSPTLSLQLPSRKRNSQCCRDSALLPQIGSP